MEKKFTIIMLVTVIILILFIAGCKNKSSSTSDQEKAKQFALTNTEKISEDIAFILQSYGDYVKDKSSIDAQKFKQEITTPLDNGVLTRYGSCAYKPISNNDGTSSGIVECTKGIISQYQQGVFGFKYQPFTADEVESAKYGHISFEIIINNSEITIYYPGWNKYSCTNFVCLPRTYYE
jgi:hypothetical protein